MTNEQMKACLVNIADREGMVSWAQSMTEKVAYQIAERYPNLDREIVGEMAKRVVIETIAEIVYN